MYDDKKNSSNIKDLIISSIKKGLEKEDLIRDTSPYWFRYYNYIQNPIDVLNPENRLIQDDLYYFVGRTSEIKVLSNYIGFSQKINDFLHIAIIGAEGIGKHTTLKIISNIISENFSKIRFEFYSYDGYDYKNSKELSDEMELKEFDDREVDIRIISCRGKLKDFLLNRLNKYHKNTKILFTIWNTSDFHYFKNININKQLFFNNYQKSEINSILAKRVEKNLEVGKNNANYSKSIKNSIIPMIAEFSSGNLKIAFEIFKEVHKTARIKNIDNINLEFLNAILKKFELIKSYKITEKESEILDFYLSIKKFKYITTSMLTKERNYDRTVAWKYLEGLCKKMIFTKIYGNPSKYKINDIFLSFYENQLKKEIILGEK